MAMTGSTQLRANHVTRHLPATSTEPRQDRDACLETWILQPKTYRQCCLRSSRSRIRPSSILGYSNTTARPNVVPVRTSESSSNSSQPLFVLNVGPARNKPSRTSSSTLHHDTTTSKTALSSTPKSPERSDNDDHGRTKAMSRKGTATNSTTAIHDATNPHFSGGDIGWQVLAPAVACATLSTATVVARWYTRSRLARCVGLDDYVIVFSVLLSWAMTAIIGLEVHSGYGNYDSDITADLVAKLIVANNNIWVVLVNITKASILIQYLRIFSSKTLRLLSKILMAALLPALGWGVFGGTFLCTPVAKLWDVDLDGHCIDPRAYWYSVAGLDFVLDFCVLLLPIPAIAGLRLPRKQKFGLLMVFLLGFFVCIVSLFRVLTVLITDLEMEPMQSGIWAIIWSAVEADVGIICASLLALKPLAVKLFPKMMQESVDRPPKYSMQLPMIEAGIWPGEEADVKLHASQTTTNTSTSVGSSTGKKSSNARQLSRQSSAYGSGELSFSRLSQVENFGIVEGEDIIYGRTREGQRMSLYEILREDADEARGRVSRRDSSFREHLQSTISN